ncbi:NAD-dependent epimerase/dehydratase family protein [Veronia pacifica]|uniref:NmrA-like domain-containing protein n=1 Tax=Veronia pacifica TaxID=1080227 RepID=A0A1C3EE97_9GAMM|nr:NAD-dependent epimerase/dehydratase family protein [Veronia pacifica]ODA31582.1 hypothetical protein A8L45_16380 [Veronia pacifica]
MKKALVLGASGGFGHYMAEALLEAGWYVVTLCRSGKASLAPELQGKVEYIGGDAQDKAAVSKAALGCSILVYGVNPPYHKWRKESLSLLSVSVDVCREQSLKMVFPGNVYNFDPTKTPHIDENTTVNPRTEKGRIRVEMESHIREAVNASNMTALIIRCGDYIGKRAPSTWLSELLSKRGGNIQIQNPDKKDTKHSFAYLPDVASSAVALLDAELADFETFHFAGYEFSMSELAIEIENKTGKRVTIKNFPWLAIRLLSLLMPKLKGVIEMRYLWQQPMSLSSKKLERYLGANAKKQTPIFDALTESELI